MRKSITSFRNSTFLLLFAASGVAHAQTPAATSQQPTNRTAFETFTNADAPAVKAREAQCGGFIEYAPRDYRFEIVGGEQEQEQRIYSQDETVFVNAGSDSGVRAGDEFVVIRPRSQFKSRFSRKDGFLGVYTEEVGRLRIVEVFGKTSAARITRACETILLGDQLRGSNSAVVPEAREETPLTPFVEPEGKLSGRIVLARDGQEMISRDQVVFIDLGAEDGVKAGDRLTIFRPVGAGDITDNGETEVAGISNDGFESEEFRGGKFSNQAPRAERPNNTGTLGGRTARTPRVKDRRPELPRKVVGEIVLTDVQRRSATAVITRTRQEIHTGDYVVIR